MSDGSTESASKRLHIAIVGSGSGALAAAIEAVERGARVTLIEAAELIGGTCVNTGCVPSKMLIRSAYVAYFQGHHGIAGVPLTHPQIDRRAMVSQQQEGVGKLRVSKYESIIESNADITLLRGMARFKDRSTLTVALADGNETSVNADRILLAVGASAHIPEITGLDGTPFWTSTEALVAEKIPARLIVLGSSAVALEIAQAFRHLGSSVTLLARSTLLSKEDPEIGAALKSIFEDEGIDVRQHCTVSSVTHDGGIFQVETSMGVVQGEQFLVAVGRHANTEQLNLKKSGVETDGRGRIVVDAHLRTNIENIFAVGDCTDQPQFVYVAAAAGTRAARNMTGGDAAIDLSVLPTVTFTTPQVATVGLSVDDAKTKGIAVNSRTLPLEFVPRALANFDSRGFIKLVVDAQSGRLLGCQLVAAEGGEVIQSAALAIKNGMTVDALADQFFAYLTMTEGLKLCAQTFRKDVRQLSCCAG